MGTANGGGFSRIKLEATTARAPVRPGGPACHSGTGGIRMNLMALFIACLVLLPVHGLAADDGYGYPIQGAYEASIIGTPAKLMPDLPENIRTRRLVLRIFPERRTPPIFFYDRGLRCTAAFQRQKAPLVFLLGGTASSDQTAKLMTMLKAFYQAGFHVITLPSPSSSNFIVSASQYSVPGDLTEDADDLYRAMEAAWEQVKGDIEVSSFNLCGYSLGATQFAFAAKRDEERRVFNFRRVLMINPSVNLYNSVTRIEDMLKRIPGGPKKEGAFFNRLLAKFSQFYQYGNFVAIDENFLYSIYAEKLFSQEETAGLIGLSYRIGLSGMVFSSDVVTNSGYVVPKNRVLGPYDPTFDYFLVSTHLSFYNYFDEYLYPFFRKKRPGLTRQKYIASQGLMSIEGYLKASDKFGVMTNENDFILTRAELDYLRQLFGERTKVYPRGGHLGNLEYKDNLAYMVAFFK